MHQRKCFGMLAVVAVICFTNSQLIAQGTKGSKTATVPPVTFAAPVDYTVGTLPFANVTADFNGDHILDIAVVNYTSNNVSVLFGNGNGTFETAVNYPVGTEPTAITTADFNGDGIPDIAVADEIGQTVGVLINNGDGTFKPVVLYPAGHAPRGIVAGDLRGIGILDLVVANNLGGDVTVFLGNGDGTFKAGVDYAADVNPKSVAVADFNGDSHLDIVCVNHNTNDASILIGNGDGTFQAPVNYATGTDPRHVLVADFNKDGKWDLAVANGGESTVSILYGNGDGTFQPQVKYNTSTSPRWLAIADYNNDGFLDVASSNYDAKNISVLLGTGSSTAGQAFLSPQNYIVGANPTGLVAGDFNGDGLPDIAVTIGGLPTAPNTIMAVLLNVAITVSPTSLSFPAQVLATTSAPQVVTLTNGAPNSLTITSIALGGTDLADYKQTNNCGTALSGNASCAINVTFTPKAINSRPATLTITDSAPGGKQTVAITGIGTNASLSPTSLTFASQTVGTTSAAQVITLTDAAAGNAIAISSIAVTGTNSTDFAISANTCGTTLLAKKSCTISVTFDPTAIGARSASVTITDNGGASPQNVPLTGTGTSSVTISPTTLTFPLQVLGTTSAAQAITVTNGTSTALTISSIAYSGGNTTDFPETNNCGSSLAATSSCTINVTFKPTNINHRASTLTITTSGGTFPVAVSGTSTAASFSPTSLTFAAQTVGTTSAAQNITMSNASGGTAITITGITITGTNMTDFAISANTCGTSLAPKKSCTITVTFDPTATGTRSASVSVADNAGSSPQSVPLTGTGQ